MYHAMCVRTHQGSSKRECFVQLQHENANGAQVSPVVKLRVGNHSAHWWPGTPTIPTPAALEAAPATNWFCLYDHK